MPTSKILVTGASGQLGGFVVDGLLEKVSKEDIAVLVRREDAKAAFEARGIEARVADYTDPAALQAAFAGVDRLLLISSSEVGQRAPQHQNVIDAAKAAGVGFVAYTSLLGASEGGMLLADEHVATEAALKASGLPHTLLRNGWYNENMTMSMGQELAMGQRFGAAGEGKFSTASRADYAQAAVAVLTNPEHDGKIFELGGTTSYTHADYAKALSSLSGKTVTYVNLPEEALKDGMVGAGLPEPLAAILADSDAKAGAGALFTDSTALSDLIGRPTTPIEETIKVALAEHA